MKNKYKSLCEKKLNWISRLEPYKYIDKKIDSKLLKKLNFNEEIITNDRNLQLILLNKQLKQKNKIIESEFQIISDGPFFVGLHTYVIDNLLKKIFDITNKSFFSNLTIIALGGYGRGELAPHSDIDILFLIPEKKIQ